MSHVFRDHPTTSAALLLWLALWIVMALSWLYDPAGYTVGMPMPVFFAVLASPLVAGLIAGWPRSGLWPGLKAGMLTGALFGAANILGNLLWSLIVFLRGRIPSEQPFTALEGYIEFLGFLLLFMVVGAILGGIGGWLGAAFSGRTRPKHQLGV